MRKRLSATAQEAVKTSDAIFRKTKEDQIPYEKRSEHKRSDRVSAGGRLPSRILTDNRLIYTSLVVEIMEERTDYACFETLNSVYKVRLQPVPARVTLPTFLKMCA